MRIAIAGFQHETNTFAPGVAGLAEFRMADSWPRMLHGAEVITETTGMNLPIAGAAAAAGEIDLVPILWCAAEPSGPVTDEAFDWISGKIIDGLRTAGPLDGIYLDLHGAMVTDTHDDGEGRLVRMIREVFGLDLTIGVSLDLHANISPQLVEDATVVTIYRTYPHLDMAETGARCMHHLRKAIGGKRYIPAFRQIPFLVPLHTQHTGSTPCRELYAGLDAFDSDETFADIAMGFTAADIHDCGPSILAYADAQARANDIADHLAASFLAARDSFATSLVDAATAVRDALTSGARPIVLADVQDNPGAGGTSDTTGLLNALITAGARETILGVLCDPDFARQAHQAGTDAVLETKLGAKTGQFGTPVSCRFRVERLSDGKIAYTGEMYGGGIATLGPSCLISVDHPDVDIRIVVSSVRVQCLDRALFTHFGPDPAAARLICVKSTVHYRADFEPIAAAIINVEAPGAFPCRLRREAYRALRGGVDCL